MLALFMWRTRVHVSSGFLCDRKAAAAGVDETQYMFLKRACQVLVELGTSQIARLWVCCTIVFADFVCSACMNVSHSSTVCGVVSLCV